MFDEYLIDSQIDMLTEYECQDCGEYLSIDYSGNLHCPGCGTTYAIEQHTTYNRREVN